MEEKCELYGCLLCSQHVVFKEVGTLLGIDFDERMNDKLTKYLQIIGQKRHLVSGFLMIHQIKYIHYFILYTNIANEPIYHSFKLFIIMLSFGMKYTYNRWMHLFT